MELSEPIEQGQRPTGGPATRVRLATAAVCGLLLLLALPVARLLMGVWRESDSFSHGPLVALFAVGLLWQRRRELAGRPSPVGMVLLFAAALVYVLGFAGDVDLFKSVGCVGLLAGAAAVMWGFAGLRAAGPGLGLILFTIPWPTAAMERLAFPAQMMSSSYAALLAGVLGQRVHRAGVHLSALGADGEPVYYIFVTRACSGLTSLVVLLALAYLVAAFTPGSFGRRLGLFAAALPLSILANAVRLVIILLAGAHISKAVATWVHDHETPVLVTLCLLALLGIRRMLLAADGSRPRRPSRNPGAPAVEPLPETAPAAGVPRWAGGVLCGVLLLALAGREWGTRSQRAAGADAGFITISAIPYRDWTTQELHLSQQERDELKPEAVLFRQYQAPDGQTVDLSVIAGRRKGTIHSPGSCFVGCGWERLLESRHTLVLDGRAIPTTRALLLFGGRKILLTFLFTDGEYTSSSLLPFQGMQLAKRLTPHPPMQAVVRITTPVEGDSAAEEALSDEFLRGVLPPLLHQIRTAGQEQSLRVGHTLSRTF